MTEQTQKPRNVEERFRANKYLIGDRLHRKIHLLDRNGELEQCIVDGSNLYVGRMNLYAHEGGDYVATFGTAQIKKYEDSWLSQKFPSLIGKSLTYEITTGNILEPFKPAGLTGQLEYEWNLHQEASKKGITLPREIVRSLFESEMLEEVNKLFREYWELKAKEDPRFIRQVQEEVSRKLWHYRL